VRNPFVPSLDNATQCLHAISPCALANCRLNSKLVMSSETSSSPEPHHQIEPFEDAQIWGPRVTEAMQSPNRNSAAANARAHRVARSQSSVSDATSTSEPEAFTFDDLQPGERLSISGISSQSHILGITLATGLLLAIQLAFVQESRLWRTPFFLAVLSLFHYCEFFTYARWNLKNTTTDSFLTLSNGPAYIAAMSSGLVETTVTSVFFPHWQARWSPPWLQVIGVVLVVVGQLTRHWAIATAGTSFNHHVQHKRRSDHVVITWGPYAWWRHPSYFGFYWWALGTQILLGNALTTPLFAVVLWRFFFRRIPSECAIFPVCFKQVDHSFASGPRDVPERYNEIAVSTRMKIGGRDMMWAR
jgi:protein-S-isoprenylcysteine O-methyltransferase